MALDYLMIPGEFSPLFEPLIFILTLNISTSNVCRCRACF
jgi:hypothetical protein